MTKIRTIIIEDEHPAQDILKSFIGRVEWMELHAVFDDSIEPMEYLANHEIDLVFLDIQVPSQTGIDFLKIVKNLPQIIVTTAYSEYAVEAFELNVCDYLIKPFSFTRFLKAVNRVALKPEPRQLYPLSTDRSTQTGFAFFNVNKTMVKVEFDEVLYVESMREYIYIHTTKGKVITKMGIGEIEKKLQDQFLRVHRSYLVNKGKITAYNAEEIFVDKISLPIGPNFKKYVETEFGNFR